MNKVQQEQRNAKSLEWWKQSYLSVVEPQGPVRFVEILIWVNRVDGVLEVHRRPLRRAEHEPNHPTATRNENNEFVSATQTVIMQNS